MKGHRIVVSDDVYDHLKGMINDEHVSNGDMSEERNEAGETIAHKPTFSEVIDHLIQDNEDNYKKINVLETELRVVREARDEWISIANKQTFNQEHIKELEAALKEATEKAKRAPLLGTRSEDLEYEETHGR
jgi:predicted CopG family antitoxin